MNPKSLLQIGLLASAGILLLAEFPASAQNGIWSGTASGQLWNTTGNWVSGIVADGSAATGKADFSQVDIPAGTFTVHLNASHTLTNLLFGDTVVGTAGSWLLDDNASSGANTLTLSGTNPVITVNALGTSATATISAVVAGTSAWSKGGAGVLILSGNNTYDAPTTVGGGTLTYPSIGNVGAGASALGSPTTAANGKINLAGSSCLLRYTGSSAATDRILNIANNNCSIVNDAVSQTLDLNGAITNNGSVIAQFQLRPLGSSSIINANGKVSLGTAMLFGNGGNTGANALNINNPANDFTNLLQVTSGRVNVASLTNAGLPCAAGAGSVVQIAANGVLGYIGTNKNSTDRLIMILGNNAQIANNSPNGSTLTLNGAISNTVPGTNSQTVFRGTADTIVNGPLLLASNFLYKIDLANLYLNNPTNAFTNFVQTASGSIYFNSITNAGIPCALGKANILYFLPTAGNPARYNYTGGSASSDRTWTFQTVSGGTGSGAIGNYGTGTLTLNGPINAQSATMKRELNLDAMSNNIVVNGAIALQSSAGFEPVVGLSQRGPFTVTLNNVANSIPGTLSIFNGTLSVSSVAAMGVGPNPGINLGNVNSAYATYPNTTGKFQFTGASGGTVNVPINVVADSQGLGSVGGIIENTVAGQTLTMSGSVIPCDLNQPGSASANYSSPACLTLTGAGNGVLSADITGSPILSITKSGSGTWTLPGNNTYTGSTVVSNGTLVVSGTIGGGTTNATVVAGGKLAGIATIADAVNVLAGGTLSPGTANIPSTLTINNGLNLAGVVAVTINKSLVQSNSLLIVSGTVTNQGGASILVDNVGPAIAVGNSFTLFSQAVSNSAAITISPAPGAGLAWQNNLEVDGSISVVAGTASYPTNLTSSVSGNVLTLTWPTTHLGWILQSQTNALTVGLTTPTNTWFDVVGSAASNTNVIHLNSANPAVFYRLRNP